MKTLKQFLEMAGKKKFGKDINSKINPLLKDVPGILRKIKLDLDGPGARKEN
tara:strand:- start:2359 stop:2514 length:156 start_codon:yes stop_codon:yes gene_type:complete